MEVVGEYHEIDTRRRVQTACAVIEQSVASRLIPRACTSCVPHYRCLIKRGISSHVSFGCEKSTVQLISVGGVENQNFVLKITKF